MTEKSEAMRLADALEMSSNHGLRREAAAELRRLAKVEDEWAALSQDQGKLEGQIDRLVAQRDALLEALIRCRNRFFPSDQPERDRDELWEPVNAAIKAVEENQ